MRVAPPLSRCRAYQYAFVKICRCNRERKAREGERTPPSVLCSSFRPLAWRRPWRGRGRQGKERAGGTGKVKAPALPRGAVRGCSYLKWRAEGRFSLSPGWPPTPPNSMLSLFRKDSISRFFLFFAKKNFVVDEKSTFHHHYHFSSDHTSTSFIDIHMGFHFL